MFEEHPNHTIIVTLADFGPQIGFGNILPVIAKEAQKKLAAKQWNVLQNSVTLRQTQGLRYSFYCDFRKAITLSLGWKTWKDKGDTLLNLSAAAIEKMEVETVPLVQLRTAFYAQLGMRHDELVDLMFDNLLMPRSSFQDLPGKVYDAFVQIHFDLESGHKLKSDVVAMTAEQALSHFDTITLLETVTESKTYDQEFDEFRRDFQQDSLMVAVEVVVENVARSLLLQTFRKALEEAEEYTRYLVNRIRAIKQRGGSSHG